ncbi:GerAB/ArcD/ProY family transporter [Desmospora profundinema]|uniref:Spore germination protein n=1 Tax=Desmospora profundinema TaxID=1571184 RepID=A0ABU1IN35_9BACL|nr:GerAB/ArcD/ProY family transporter [Desmospora profundinema]MDR6226205.1 spore germination protein [Desmospora profundinema]
MPSYSMTRYQMTVVLISSIVGAGIITLPRVAVDASEGSPDVWISMLVSGVISLSLGVFIVKFARRFPGKTLFQYSQTILGKPLGILVGLFYCLYFLCVATYSARIQAEVIRLYLLETTPIGFLVFIFILMGVYPLMGGWRPYVRLHEFFLPLIMLIFLLVLAQSIPGFDLDRLRPVLQDGWKPIVKALESTIYASLGFEIMLVLAAFMNSTKETVQATLMGIGVPILLYTTTIIIVVGVLTPEATATITYPLLEMTTEIAYPALFFERFELFFFVGWVITIYTTFGSFYYVSAHGLHEMFGWKIETTVKLLIPVAYVLAIFPQNVNQMFRFSDFVGYAALVTAGAIPFLLWIVAGIRRAVGGN